MNIYQKLNNNNILSFYPFNYDGFEQITTGVAYESGAMQQGSVTGEKMDTAVLSPVFNQINARSSTSNYMVTSAATTTSILTTTTATLTTSFTTAQFPFPRRVVSEEERHTLHQVRPTGIAGTLPSGLGCGDGFIRSNMVNSPCGSGGTLNRSKHHFTHTVNSRGSSSNGSSNTVPLLLHSTALSSSAESTVGVSGGSALTRNEPNLGLLLETQGPLTTGTMVYTELRENSSDLDDINIMAIKDCLMTQRVPESCVWVTCTKRNAPKQKSIIYSHTNMPTIDCRNFPKLQQWEFFILLQNNFQLRGELIRNWNYFWFTIETN